MSLNQEFVSETQRIKEYLIGVKKKFLEFDKNNPSEQAQIEFIEKNKKEIFECLTNHFNITWGLINNFLKKEFLTHQKFYQKELHPLLKTPPLNERIYEKPLGYAGDFITTNYFYEDDYPGNSTYEKLINRYTLSIPITRAHINRRKYFKKLILETIEKNRKSKEIRISSFACGSAIEFLDILKEDKASHNLIFTGIDAEPLVIQYIQQNIREIRENKRKKCNVVLIHENILNLIRKKKQINGLLNQKLIYCSGFLDYLSDATASRTIEYLFNLLIDDGVLVLVNVSAENPLRSYYEVLGEWHLHYRSADQMLKLANRINNAKDIYVDFEPETKMNLFLILKK